MWKWRSLMNYTAARMPRRAWYAGLSWAVALWLTAPVMAAESPVGGGGGKNSVTTRDVVVEADKAKEEAKYNSQSVTVITKEDIARKQGKSVEDVIFNEVGVTGTVDAMGTKLDTLLQNPKIFYSNFSNADIIIRTDGGDLDLRTAEGNPNPWGGNNHFLSDLGKNKNDTSIPNSPWQRIDNAKYGAVEGLLNSQNIKVMMGDILDASALKYNGGTECIYLDHEGREITREQAVNQIFCSFVGIESYYNGNELRGGDGELYNGTSKFLYVWMANGLGSFHPVGNAPIPLPLAQQG